MVLSTYRSNFYAGMPALTRNELRPGACYFVAARATGTDFLTALYRNLRAEQGH
jgi:beta-galactosidase